MVGDFFGPILVFMLGMIVLGFVGFIGFVVFAIAKVLFTGRAVGEKKPKPSGSTPNGLVDRISF
jgi:hypothetical protein